MLCNYRLASLCFHPIGDHALELRITRLYQVHPINFAMLIFQKVSHLPLSFLRATSKKEQ